MADGLDFPRPKDWQRFERICRELWAEIWGDPEAKLHGRSGQAQHGVDIYGYDRNGKLCGVQCKKRKDRPDEPATGVSEAELIAEVEAAKAFQPVLNTFVLATTSERDTNVQEVARKLSEAHSAVGLFRVEVASWDDICDALVRTPQVVLAQFPEFHETFRKVDLALSVTPSHAASATSAPGGASLISRDELHAEHDAALDRLAALYAAGQPSRVIEELGHLKPRIWSRASAEVRARLIGMEGLCKLSLGQETEGARLMLDAMKHDGGTVRSLSQAALAHSLLGNDQAAVAYANQVLDRAPSNTDAWQIKVLHCEQTDEEVLAGASAIVGAHAAVYAALGNRAVRRKDLAKAGEWFDKAFALQPDSEEIAATRAQVRIDLIVGAQGLERNRSDEDKRHLQELADELLARWEGLQDRNMQRARSRWLYAALSAFHALGASRAVDLGERLVEIAPDDTDYARLYALALADRDRFRDALRVIARIKPVQTTDLALQGTFHASLGEIDKALELWQQVLGDGSAPRDILEMVRFNYVRALHKAHRASDACEFADALKKQFPESPSIVRLALLDADLANDSERTNAAIDKLSEFNLSILSPYECLSVGDALALHGRFTRAAAAYAAGTNTSTDTEYMRRYAQCLFNASDFPKVLEVCSELASKNSFYLGLVCQVHEETGNLSGATHLCERFLEKHPDAHSIRLRLATYLHRRGEVDSVIEHIQAIEQEWISEETHRTQIVGHLLSAANFAEGALDLYYEARKRNPDNPQAHLLYLKQYFERRDRSVPSEVAPETAVLIEGAGAPGWVLLSNDASSSLENKAFALGSELAKAAMGLRKGESLDFRAAQGPDWRIEDIGTRYAFAMNESLRVFSSRFPTDQRLRPRSTPEDARELVETLKKELQPGETRWERVETMYACGAISLGVVGHALGLNPIHTLNAILGSPAGLRAYSGSVDERSAAHQELSTKPDLVLDLSSAVVMSAVGSASMDALVSEFNVVISQSTIDAAAEARHDLLRQPESSLSLGLQRGRVVMYEATAETMEGRRERLEQLADWLRTAFDVAVIEPAKLADWRQRTNAAPVVNDCYWDSALIASQGRLLVSDDLVFRQVAHRELKTRSVCTWSVLTELNRRGKLTSDGYEAAMLGLIRLGYRTVPVSVQTLKSAAEEDRAEVGAAFRATLRNMEGPHVDRLSALVVCVGFLRALWLEPILELRRTDLLFAMMDSMIVGRHPGSTVALLRRLVAGMFALMPAQEREVTSLIDDWSRLRAVRI